MAFYTQQEVLFKRLVDAELATVVLPNKTPSGPKPLIMASYVSSVSNPGISDGGKMHRGVLTANLIFDLNKGDKAATTLAGQVAALFPFGLTLDCGDRKMRVDKEPSVLRDFQTETSWCVPVQVSVIITKR